MSVSIQAGRGVDNFFAAPSLRTDQWVKVLAAARAWQSGKDKPAARKAIADLLVQLAPIESFHAYPGPRLLEHLKARYDADDAKGFYFLAQRISTAIISRNWPGAGLAGR